MSRARPVHLTEPIIGCPDAAQRFALNGNILAEMQSTERLLLSKVAVISVAGAFRKGKSFLLNFFLRYLRALSRGDATNWLRSEDNLSDGFHWRSGSDRDTTGILIWSEPFFITKPNGEEVAVLLMDTQGTFDHQSTQQDCTTIFAFSTLLSSVQIFNISQNIQETDLQYLRLFVEFAAMASDSQDSVLQHLWFLIRDWQFPDEHEFGIHGGKMYLRKVLDCDDSKPQENQELRLGILKHFQRTMCYLLPHPGRDVTRQNFQGELSKLDPDFLGELERFVPRVLSPDNLVAKTINGRSLTGRELFNYASVYYEAFRSGKLPSPKTIFSATVDMTNMAVAKASRELFDKEVQSRVNPTAAIAEDELDKVLNAVMHEVLDQFDRKCMQKGSAGTAECRQRLADDLRYEFQQHQLMNRLRSDKIAVEQKNQMLADDIQGLQKENVEATRKMRLMEEEFQKKVKEISESSVSKEEMESMLEKEAMRHRLAQQDMEARNVQLASKIEALAEKNSDLVQKMKESQEERNRQVRLMEERMEEWKRQQQAEERNRRESELHTKALFASALTFLAPIAQGVVGVLLSGAGQQNHQASKQQGGSAKPGQLGAPSNQLRGSGSASGSGAQGTSPQRTPQASSQPYPPPSSSGHQQPGGFWPSAPPSSSATGAATAPAAGSILLNTAAGMREIRVPQAGAFGGAARQPPSQRTPQQGDDSCKQQ